MHVCARPMRSFTFKTQLYYWHDNIKAFVHQTVLEKEICMYRARSMDRYGSVQYAEMNYEPRNSAVFVVDHIDCL